MDPIIETLLQTGATGIIAYLLIQYQREQAREHREEMRALIESNNAALQHVAAMLEKTANELDSLETQVDDLAQRAVYGCNPAQFRSILCNPVPNPPATAELNE